MENFELSWLHCLVFMKKVELSSSLENGGVSRLAFPGCCTLEVCAAISAVPYVGNQGYIVYVVFIW